MTNPSNSNPTSPDLVRRKLALHTLGPKVDVGAAKAACETLEPHLPEPRLLESITPFTTRFLGASLFRAPENPSLQDFPEVLFSDCRELAPGDFPQEWLEAYTHWGRKLRRGRELELLHDRCSKAIHETSSEAKLGPQDSAVAATVLYLLNPPPSMPMRQSLRAWALGTPFGAYISSQGHLLREEREAINQAINSDSRYLFWLSRTSGFQGACVRGVKSQYDLWAGLTLLLADDPEDELGPWLKRLALAACEQPAAACAALVLQPQMDHSIRELWLSTLLRKPAPRHALETALFAKYTSRDSDCLVNELRPQAGTAEHGRIWFSWFSLVEPERAQSEVDCNPR